MSQISLLDEDIPEEVIQVNWDHSIIDDGSHDRSHIDLHDIERPTETSQANGCDDTANYDADNEQEDNDAEEVQTTVEQKIKKILAKPPPLCLFVSSAVPKFKYPDPGSDSEEDDILLQGSNFRDQDTTFGKYFTKTTVTETQSLLFDDNKEQLKHAKEFLTSLSEPLAVGCTWCVRIFFVIILVTNFAMVMYDIIRKGDDRRTYHYVASVVSCLEIIVFTSMHAILWKRRNRYGEDEKQSYSKSDLNMDEDVEHITNIGQLTWTHTNAEHTTETSNGEVCMELHNRNIKRYESSNTMSESFMHVVVPVSNTHLDQQTKEDDQQNEQSVNQNQNIQRNFKKDPEENSNRENEIKQNKKRDQYIENIVTEIFLYVLIIVTVFGASTERHITNWNTDCTGVGFDLFEKCAKEYIERILLFVDVIDLLYNQIMRMVIIHRILQSMKEQVAQIKDQGDTLIERARLALIGNIVLFFLMITILYIQVWVANPNSEKTEYNTSPSTILMLLLLIFLPNYSAFLFFLANSYWVLKLFIQVNINMSNPELQHQMRQEYGDIVADAMQFAAKKAEESRERLNDLGNISSNKKILYCISELPAVLALLLWMGMVCGVIGAVIIDYFYFPESLVKYKSWVPFVMIVIYLIILLVVNHHLVLLSLIILIVALCGILGLIVYPLAIYMLFYKKARVANSATADM